MPVYTMEEQQEIATTIVYQLCGAGTDRLKTMLGARNFSIDKHGALSFDFKMCNKANIVKIQLNANDLYDVTFYKIHNHSLPVVHEEKDVFADMLREVFTKFTGLDTKL